MLPKIEVIKQRDLKDCGACCIETILKYYGGYVPLEKIRDDTCTSINGTTAFHIIKALCNYGFDWKLYIYEKHEGRFITSISIKNEKNTCQK